MDVIHRLFHGGELTTGFNDVFCTQFAPGDFLGFVAVVDQSLLTVDDDAVVGDLNVALEAAVNGVVLQQVFDIVGSQTGTVHCNELYIITVDCQTENQTADTAKSIDTDFDCHSRNPPFHVLHILFFLVLK